MRKWREKSNVIFKKIWHLDQNEKKTANKPMYIRTKKD